MIRHGSATTQDKIFAALTYLIPLLSALPFGILVFAFFPPLALPFVPLFAILPIYGSFGVSFGVFLALYFFVVQNRQLSHFLRFNTLQAILIAIFIELCRAVLELLGISRQLLNPIAFSSGNSFNLLSVEMLLAILFIGVLGTSIYAIAQCLRGIYAEIPIVSEAANQQVP